MINIKNLNAVKIFQDIDYLDRILFLDILGTFY
jgi:hypothetical protein